MPLIDKANWHVQYAWSASSGLRLGVCRFAGIRVIHNASVPFVYVNYEGDSSGPFTDELRSTTSKVEVREIMNGFDLKVTYDLYGPDYEYNHVWRFHDDGQFGSTIVIQGPGEEIDGHHTYHLPFRFDLDISGASGDSFQRRVAAGAWQDVPFEGRHLPIHPWAPNFDWRVIDKASGRSALIRARAMDDAELWALQYKVLESWSTWGTAGPGTPGAAGSVPAVYDNGQSVQNTNLVVWYIAHVPSVERVTACGPWFRLQGYPEVPHEDGDHHHDDHDNGPPDH
ncbi:MULTISPECIES: hypothetical protein [Paraburkholderia]|uniref:hypothetical protein n=1 Tax=Paraburkholderia TaxID=1822464 RepID=UPI0038BC199D